MSFEVADAVYQIWDEVSEFGAKDTQKALAHLLDRLCIQVEADHAFWLPALRFGSMDSDDILYGWRPRAYYATHDLPSDGDIYQDTMNDYEAGSADESSIRHARNAGKFRAVLMRDHVSPNFFKSPQYRRNYVSRGISDSAFVVCPVNADAECYFGFNRVGRDDFFTPHDLELLAFALRGMRWFHKRLLLSHGLQIADTPLTAAEHRILKQLLTDKSEKQIADILGLAPSTTHAYVTTVFRKLNIRSRAALMALWLNP